MSPVFRPRINVATLTRMCAVVLAGIAIVFVIGDALPAARGWIRQNLAQRNVPAESKRLNMYLSALPPGNILWIPGVSEWANQYDPLHPSISVLQFEQRYEDLTGYTVVNGASSLPWVATPKLASAMFSKLDICYIVFEASIASFQADSLNYAAINANVREAFADLPAYRISSTILVYSLGCPSQLVSVVPSLQSTVRLPSNGVGRSGGVTKQSDGAVTPYWIDAAQAGIGPVFTKTLSNREISIPRVHTGLITVTHLLSHSISSFSGILDINTPVSSTVVISLFSRYALKPVAEDTVRIPKGSSGKLGIPVSITAPCEPVSSNQVYESAFVELTLAINVSPKGPIAISPLRNIKQQIGRSGQCGLPGQRQGLLYQAYASPSSRICTAQATETSSSSTVIDIQLKSSQSRGCSAGDVVVVFENYSPGLIAESNNHRLKHEEVLGWANGFRLERSARNESIVVSLKQQSGGDIGILIADATIMAIVIGSLLFAVRKYAYRRSGRGPVPAVGGGHRHRPS